MRADAGLIKWFLKNGKANFKIIVNRLLLYVEQRQNDTLLFSHRPAAQDTDKCSDILSLVFFLPPICIPPSNTYLC